MLVLFLLAGCAENLEKEVCDSVDGDIHVLTPSAESGLQEAAAQFHVHLHSHTVDITEDTWIWVTGVGQQAFIYTDATIAKTLLDGQEQSIADPIVNETCVDSLANVYEVNLSEGVWDFQLSDTGTFNWIAVPVDEDHSEHEHDHDHDH